MKEFIRVVKKAASALHLGTKKSVSQLRRVSSTLNLRRHIREQRSIREGLRRNHMLCDSRESDEYDTTQPITELDILRYRYHHGANLGGVFVLEKFLAPNMFDGCEKDSENEAVMHSIKVRGLQATKLMWEAHWASALSDEDIDYLANVAHCTSVRIPIGHWTVQKLWHWKRMVPDLPTDGTDKLSKVMDVYENAWPALMNLCTRLHAAGIGCLIDLHGFGANNNPHSGSLLPGSSIWGLDWDTKNKELIPGENVVETIGLYLTGKSVKGATTKIPGCIGYQICNEAEVNARGMYDFYNLMIQRISDMDPTLPIYISDAWNLEKTIQWLAPRSATMSDTVCPVIIDTHNYYCHDEASRRKSPQHIVAEVQRELGFLPSLKGEILTKGAVDVIIGEWSNVMSVETWRKVSGADRIVLRNQFGQIQSKRWRLVSSGHYFWTLKSHGEWDFFEQVRQDNIYVHAFLRLTNAQVSIRTSHAMQQKDRLLDHAVTEHANYWKDQDPKNYEAYEHHRYEIGWRQGWQDAFEFFSARLNGKVTGAKHGADRIGLLDNWIVKRMRESGQSGPFLWEWEHGFRRGVRDLEACTTYDQDGVPKDRWAGLRGF